MSRIISRAESYETVYGAFKQVNFTAFDYYSIKQSMIDYLQLYFPESFNDYIESSEFISLLEIFAYLGELMAYRFDINSAENVISLGQRKSSILRLATLISYKSSRNTPARGLVKVNSISTSEKVFDSQGKDISNTVIIWNDPNNSNWKDQFFVVMDKVLQQNFGTVSPNERVQVNDIIFELYPLKNNPLNKGVIPYQSSLSGKNYGMELVSAQLTENGPIESRPQNLSNFNIMYANDGLGDNSTMTGFLMYTKQGTLNKTTLQFDGIIPNQTHDLSIANINDTDIWVNNVNPDTGLTLDDGSSTSRKSGEWEEVNLTNAENIVFNTNPIRTKFEVETLENDQVRLIFGDGDFSDIPSGSFDVWYRTSVPDEIYIPRTAIVEKRASMTYTDTTNRTQNVTFTFSLVSSLQNNSASEDIDHIRRTAPSVYYTQDRMVNGRDYNSFPLKDPSILKLRTINRTFAGDTKYQSANDPSFTYQNVKIFGNDLSIFYPKSISAISAPITSTSGTLLTNFIEPALSTLDLYIKHAVEHSNISKYRRFFLTTEHAQIMDVLDDVTDPWPVSILYFDSVTTIAGVTYQPDSWVAFSSVIDTSDRVPDITITKSSDYTITYNGLKLVGESKSTQFFYDNENKRILSFDSLDARFDELNILQANLSSNTNTLLSEPISLNIVQVDRYTEGSTLIGLPNLNRVVLSTKSTESNTLPQNIDLPQLMHHTTNVAIDNNCSTYAPLNIMFPDTFIVGAGDTTCSDDGVLFAEGAFKVLSTNDATRSIIVPQNLGDTLNIGDKIRLWSNNTIGNLPSRYEEHIVESFTISGNTTTIIIVENFVFVEDLESVLMNIVGVVANNVLVFQNDNSLTSTSFFIKEYVYFDRIDVSEEFVAVPKTNQIMLRWYLDSNDILTKRVIGKSNLNFLWKHNSSQMNLIDPATTNIHDMFIITRPFYTQFSKWLSGDVANVPSNPTPQSLRTTYSDLLNNKMFSDTVILQPGKFKVIIGSKSAPELRAKIKVIRSTNRTLSDNQVKIRIVNIVRNFFDVNDWQFGETFNYTELHTAIQNQMPSEIASTVLVPLLATHTFGDLYQVFAQENEILQVHISVDDIEIVENYNSINLRQTV